MLHSAKLKSYLVVEKIGDTSFTAGKERERSIPGFILLFKAALCVTFFTAPVDKGFYSIKEFLLFICVHLFAKVMKTDKTKTEKGKIHMTMSTVFRL